MSLKKMSVNKNDINRMTADKRTVHIMFYKNDCEEMNKEAVCIKKTVDINRQKLF